MLPENEVTEFDNRTYVNPQLAIDEGNSFIDKLRSTQQANNQQIKTQTYNLGKAVPSNLGGLVGGEGYWTSRYQTPAMNTLANDLRAANRKIALEQAMQNDISMWQNRYNAAKRAYQSRANGGGGNGGDGGNGDGGNGDGTKKPTGNPLEDGLVDEEYTSLKKYKGDAPFAVTSEGLDETPLGSNGGVERIATYRDGYVYVQDTYVTENGTVVTRIADTDDPSYHRASDGYMYNTVAADDGAGVMDLKPAVGGLANSAAGEQWAKDIWNVINNYNGNK